VRIHRQEKRRDSEKDSELVSQPETDEDVLTFDVPDAALEWAASTEGQAFTLAYCTHQLGQFCLASSRSRLVLREELGGNVRFTPESRHSSAQP
jgi:hypothetical protein